MLPVAVTMPPLPEPTAAAEPSARSVWPSWLPVDTTKGPDLLAAAGGLALVVLGLRVLLGGRRHQSLN